MQGARRLPLTKPDNCAGIPGKLKESCTGRLIQWLCTASGTRDSAGQPGAPTAVPSKHWKTVKEKNVITTIYVIRTAENPKAVWLLNRLHHESFTGIENITIETVYRLEGVTPDQARTLAPLFHNPAAENMGFSSMLGAGSGPVIEIGYQRAVTDPELPSVIRGASALGVDDLQWVRISHRYQFTGISGETAQQIAARFLYNPQVQVIIPPGYEWDTLKPQGEPGPVESISLLNHTDEELARLSEERRLFLTQVQLAALKDMEKQIGRPLTDAELEMFAQTWSDHCFHTTWKSLGLLEKLFTTTKKIDHPQVLSVFEDNAGAFEFYDGWALTVKGETHNSPSAVSPYGGIMTKHGGVIRDTLGCGQGAKPIGGTTVMGLGDPFMKWDNVPKGALHPRTILLESIRGTADYNNPMGIPMMFPVYKFHKGYTGKCLALGHSIGLVPADRAQKGHPHTGDRAILIGGLTGRDGLHGATVSSGSMNSDTAVVDAAHVQIGHPIEERKFMEAIPVLRDSDCLRAITDLGAGGLSSAVGEMGADTGVWVNLAWVPLKTEGMHPWEIWISESQERMLLCVPPEKVDEALEILDRYEVPATVIGVFTDTDKCQVVFDDTLAQGTADLPAAGGVTGQRVVDLDFTMLRRGCPLPEIPVAESPGRADPCSIDAAADSRQLRQRIMNLLSHPDICDQSAAGTQFDSTVQGTTVMGPYSGIDGRMPNDVWVSAPLRGKSFGTVAALGFTPAYGLVDAGLAAKLMIIEPVTRLALAGVSVSDIVLCDNFYTPKVTEAGVGRALTDMVDMCCRVSMDLGTPFVSGKDSSSGTFIDEQGTRMDIPPTLAVLALGKVPDVNLCVTKPLKKPGSKLLLAGALHNGLGGSLYTGMYGTQGGPLPDPDLNELKLFWEKLCSYTAEKKIIAASAIGQGGLIRRVFEMCLGGGYGADISVAACKDTLDSPVPEAPLFAEMIGAAVLEADPDTADAMAKDLGGIIIGEVIRDRRMNIDTGPLQLSIDMETLCNQWEQPFREIIQ